MYSSIQTNDLNYRELNQYIMGLLLPKIADQSRKIQFNVANDKANNNKVDTAKYSILTFLPKSLLIQFFRLSNIVFLFNAVLQSISLISSLSPMTAIGPLAFVLGVSMLREGYQDYKRHKKDAEINSRTTKVLRNSIFIDIEWWQVKPGDFVKVFKNEIIPADILLLYSSEENSLCYVQTSNMDGENNLKQKYAVNKTIKLYPHEYQALTGYCLVDAPKANLYDFEGQMCVTGSQMIYVGYENLLLRETILKNTDEIVGIAIYCGSETKIVKNQGSVHHKVSRIQKRVNYIQICLVILLIAMCLSCCFGYYLIHINNNLRTSNSYIPSISLSLTTESGLIFFTIFLTLNFLIPITLNILIEGIKMFSGVFLSFDSKMYYEPIKKYCGVLNASIVEQLGCIDCILTDKTGTLTSNQMIFKSILIENRVYTRQTIEANLPYLENEKKFKEFWIAVVICHEIVRDQIKDEYQGSSPDEVCFINYARSIGYEFIKRTKNSIELMIHKEKLIYQLIDIIPFCSRKRMSVLVKNLNATNQILIYTKGADNCIISRANSFILQAEFQENLNIFAQEGLRTLVFSIKKITFQAYVNFNANRQIIKLKYRQKLISKDEANALDMDLINNMQNHLSILGATGIEDRLQDGVPETISRLQQAQIKIMMITGDKLQTAQNIGYLAQLLKRQFHIFKLTADLDDTNEQLLKINNQIQNKNLKISVIIEGKHINSIISQNNSQMIEIHKNIFSRAQSIIFCRSSPKEKALIVKFVKNTMKFVVLAIGDGGNDVGMIQQAHVGVGIIGKEGNSAAVVSDFSFGQFRFLDRLILHHGRWAYYRLAYFFVFFGWKNIIITFMAYFFLIDCGFSGNVNFTQLYFSFYNMLFAVSILVNFGLYDQDINDDLQPKIWNYLPHIYLQTKKKQLFSVRRYMIWTLSGIATAALFYYTIRNSLISLQATDIEGRIPDIQTFRIANGLVLVLAINIICFIDTRTHHYFFQIFVLLIMTGIPTTAYFIGQNYMNSNLESYLIYTDNFNIRFWLVTFVLVMSTFLVKLAVEAYYIQFHPSIIDQYLVAKLHGNKNLEQILRNAVQSKQLIPQHNLDKSSIIKQMSEQFSKKMSLSNDNPIIHKKSTSLQETSQEVMIKSKIVKSSTIQLAVTNLD